MTVTRNEPRGMTDSGASAGLEEAGTEPTLVPPDDARAPAPREIVVLALVAVAVGLVFRFVARTPLWLDEALSANIAQLPVSEIPDALRHDGHPPLYYVLLHAWMGVFGTTDLAVRALSGVISVATLPVAYVVGRRRGGALLGWIAVAVLAASAYATRYGTETRMYSLVMLLVLVGYLLVDDIIRRQKAGIGRLVAFGAVSGLLLLTHYWGLFLLAALGLTLAWLAWRDRGAHDAAYRGRCIKAIVAMGVGSVVLFGPWLGVMRYQSAHTGTPWSAPFRPSTTLAVTFLDFHSGGTELKDAIVPALLGAVLVGLGLFGRAVDRRHIDVDLGTVRQFRFEAVVAALTLGIGMAAGYASRSAFASRYAAVLFPLVVLLIAGGVTRFVSRPVRFGVLATYLALNVVTVVYVGLLFQRSESRVVAEAVRAKAQPGDVVVYCPDQLGPAGQREMPADLRQLAYPTLEPPQRVDWVDYGQRNAAADPEQLAERTVALAGPDHAVFVVWAGTYRTFEGQCERYVNAISARRPVSATLATDDSQKYFEHANVSYFAPSSP